MGRIIKVHWARLVVLVSAVYQTLAAVEGFIWPKIFWDFSTTKLDCLVQPIPILQIVNLILGLLVIAFEWPVPLVAGSVLHRNILPRIFGYPICSVFAILMYQSTNAGIYYLVGTGIYSWALIEGESVGAKPWTLPDRRREIDLEKGEGKA